MGNKISTEICYPYLSKGGIISDEKIVFFQRSQEHPINLLQNFGISASHRTLSSGKTDQF